MCECVCEGEGERAEKVKKSVQKRELWVWEIQKVPVCVSERDNCV